MNGLKHKTDCWTKTFPKYFVPQSVFIIDRVILINKPTFKARKKHNFNLQLIKMVLFRQTQRNKKENLKIKIYTRETIVLSQFFKNI